ncbi:hypothetical protein KEM55_006047 [Ascosphaera atra]|nr:hypothetical protein KEM55_006047 [Ascosphaera atra]
MSAEKRPAQEGFGSTQLVKRAREEGENAAGNTSVTVVNRPTQDGALIQAVCAMSSDSHHGDERYALSIPDEARVCMY